MRLLSQQEFEALHCWEAGDRVPGRPQMTTFRRRVRSHRARWRAAHGHPIGSQPIAPSCPDESEGERVRLVGCLPPLRNDALDYSMYRGRAYRGLGPLSMT